MIFIFTIAVKQPISPLAVGLPWSFSPAAKCDAVANQRQYPIRRYGGTLLGVVISIMSTNVMSGIVPNVDLLNSNAPFGFDIRYTCSMIQLPTSLWLLWLFLALVLYFAGNSHCLPYSKRNGTVTS